MDELKPKFIKYVGKLNLSIKDEQDKLSLEDIEGMMSIALMREKVQYGIEKELEEENSKFELVTDEFTDRMAKRWYVHNPIDLI
ncbi:hypothetical protein UT300005_23070 [Clostridium sp. CTA-5]